MDAGHGGSTSMENAFICFVYLFAVRFVTVYIVAPFLRKLLGIFHG